MPSFKDTIDSHIGNAILFCMPAHNGKISIDIKNDITELSFSDNLQYPTGAILETEKMIAKVYGGDHALLFTNGATSALATALALIKSLGDTLIVDNFAHKSIHSYSQLLGLTLVGANKAPIDGMRVGGVLITSPDYYGHCFDLAKARELSLEYGCPLIIDQSHGSHFVFSKLLPANQVGDIVINSLHKTLPVLTGGAVAIIKHRFFDDFVHYRSMIHSTSPSYLTMVSIDAAIRDFSQNGEIYYRDILSSIEKFKVALPERFIIDDGDDPARLVISDSLSSGSDVTDYLESNAIFVEMSISNKIVLIVTKYNHFHLPELANCLSRYSYISRHSESHTNTIDKNSLYFQRVMTTYSGNDDCEWIDILDSCGRISAQNICIYPPGIPILTNRQQITRDIYDYMIGQSKQCLGINNGKILCYKELR